MILVQSAGLLLATTVHAQGADYGTRPAQTRSTVVTMPQAADPPSPASDASQPTNATVDTPPRGMSQARVVAEYGTPVRRHSPVGQPPITRWDYPGYRLYFEYDHVLHAVVPRDPVPVAHADELARKAR